MVISGPCGCAYIPPGTPPAEVARILREVQGQEPDQIDRSTRTRRDPDQEVEHDDQQDQPDRT